jgi:hypothetical protein
MAFKTQDPMTVEAYESRSIELEISGATLRNEGADSVTLRLTGIEICEPDWATVELTLKQAGIDEMDVAFLAETFSRLTYEHLLGKALAKRAKRVG